MSLRWRVFAAFLVILATLLGVFAAWTSSTLTESYRQVVLERLQFEVGMLSRLLDPQDPALDEVVDSLAVGAPYRITVIDPDGKVVADSSFSGASLAAMENHSNREEIQLAMRRGIGSSLRYSTSVDDFLLYVAARSPGGSFFRLAMPGSEISRVAGSLGGAIGSRVLLLISIGGLATLLMCFYLTRSVARFQDAARGLSRGEIPAVPGRGGDEWVVLARALANRSARQRDLLQSTGSELSRLRLLVDNIEEGLLLIDAAGRLRLVNPAFLRLFEPIGDPIGQTTLEVVRSVELERALERSLRDRQPAELEFAYEGREIRVNLVPLPASAGDDSVVAVFGDISELRRHERMAHDFVANVSHELKTPLTSIKGYSETLLDGGLAAVERGFVEKINRNADQLGEIVNALLELARFQSRQRSLRFEAIDFEVFMKHLVGEFQKRLDEKGLTLEVVNNSGSDTFRGSEKALRRALYNLIDNAISYTEKGGVRVEMSSREDRTLFSVSDTGMGIDPADQPRVFERFYRGDAAQSPQRRGSGVGLAMVKQIVSLHGGEVWLKSQPNSGTTVYFWLPRVSD